MYYLFPSLHVVGKQLMAQIIDPTPNDENNTWVRYPLSEMKRNYGKHFPRLGTRASRD